MRMQLEICAYFSFQYTQNCLNISRLVDSNSCLPTFAGFVVTYNSLEKALEFQMGEQWK